MTGAVQGDLIIQNYLNNKIIFGTNGDSAKMVIGSAGNVGIGTTNPQTKLEIQDDGLRTNASGHNTPKAIVEHTLADDTAHYSWKWTANLDGSTSRSNN